jgi:hypothetical protein
MNSRIWRGWGVELGGAGGMGRCGGMAAWRHGGTAAWRPAGESGSTGQGPGASRTGWEA